MQAASRGADTIPSAHKVGNLKKVWMVSEGFRVTLEKDTAHDVARQPMKPMKEKLQRSSGGGQPL